MGAAAIRVTEKEDEKQGIDEQDIFDRVILFLPAITCGLFSSVLRADDPPFGAVMGKRGDTDAAVGPVTTSAGASSRGTTTVAASCAPQKSHFRSERHLPTHQLLPMM
jgi:hypothetical protein